jgi:hypothetical protein
MKKQSLNSKAAAAAFRLTGTPYIDGPFQLVKPRIPTAQEIASEIIIVAIDHSMDNVEPLRAENRRLREALLDIADPWRSLWDPAPCVVASRAIVGLEPLPPRKGETRATTEDVEAYWAKQGKR